MRKLLLLATTLLITLVSCQKEEGPAIGQTQKITVNIQATETKAGEGSQINRCILEIYEGNTLYGERLYSAVSSNTATFEISLIPSQTYEFVLWADHVETPSTTTGIATDYNYNTQDLTAITLKDGVTYKANDETFDAFYGHEANITIDGAFTKEIYLTRPFGQLSVNTLDISKISAEHHKPNYIKVEFTTALYTTFNAKTGAVSGEESNRSYTVQAADAANGNFTVDYLFADADKSSLIDFKMTYYNTDPAATPAPEAITTNDGFTNIPIRRNYQTIVSGNLVTKSGEIVVNVNNTFGNSGNETTIAASIDDLNAALLSGAKSVEYTGTITSNVEINVPKIYSAGNSETISITLPTAAGYNVTLQYDGSTETAPANVEIICPAAELLTIDLPNSHIEMPSGTYGSVSANTSETTLIVGEKCVIGTLKIVGGNTEIYGTITTVTIDEKATNAKISNYGVKSVESLKTASELARKDKCETITLTDNLDVTINDANASDQEDKNYISLAGTIDLNNNTLSIDNSAIMAQGGATITLKGGTIEGTKGGQVGCLSNSTIVLEDIVFNADGPTYAAPFINQNAENTTVIIRNSTINGGYYGLASNATKNPIATGTIILENSTFTGYESGMMINIPCTITATNCTFEGGWQGVYLRGGEATFTDCTINLKMNPAYNDWPEKYSKDGNWLDGNMAVTAALLVGNRCTYNYGAYNYPTSITLKNTKFNVSGSTNGGHTATNTYSAYIWSREEPGLGTTFNCDAATYANIGAAGAGMFIGNNGKNLITNLEFTEPWDGASATEVTPAGNIYSISTPAQLAWIAAQANGGETFEGKTIELTSNINLGSKEWTPIATGTRSGSGFTGNQFKGTFDGKSYTIYNLKISQTQGDDYAIGLFGVVNGGTVKSVNFSNVDINVPTSEMAAAAVGMLTGNGNANSVTVKSGTIAAARGNGAIVGRMTLVGKIADCKNYATITGTGANVGGIVGAAYYTSATESEKMYITNCHNYGSVSGTAGAVGGIVGLSAAYISGCYNEADITGNGADVAGIVAEQQNAGGISDCINRGDIKNNTSVYGNGGIVGWVRYSGATTAYPTKNIISLTGNTNYGSVAGGNDAGGIAGTIYNYAVVSNNKSYAESLSAVTFAADIVGNIQFTETPVGMNDPYAVTVSDNTYYESTTIQAANTARVAYVNNQDYTTLTNNTAVSAIPANE